MYYLAFMDTWKEACASASPSKVVIPRGTYLLGQVTVQVPCKAPIEVQVAGTLKAPTDPNQFNDGDGWVTFIHVDQFTMSGGGVFNDHGATADPPPPSDVLKSKNIRFNFISNAMISDITSLDSKLFHVNVLGVKNVTFDHFTITAPADSLNTDGIHIGRSTGINITNSNIQIVDDCISMGDGSQQIKIEKITCGPGHGISVGSLGKYPNEETVSGIYVKNCTISNTDNCVRVKTWPASSNGIASNLHFEDIIMDNVGNPVIIDQEYCLYYQCTHEVLSRIKISNVSFKNIRDTSATPLAVKLVCSMGIPCENVEVGDINHVYNGAAGGSATSQCANVQPKFSGNQNIPICAANSH